MQRETSKSIGVVSDLVTGSKLEGAAWVSEAGPLLEQWPQLSDEVCWRVRLERPRAGRACASVCIKRVSLRVSARTRACLRLFVRLC